LVGNRSRDAPGRGNIAVAILGFERPDEAERYLRELKEHLREFGLELNEEKTRLIRFGRLAAKNRAERGEGKPEAFTFLGFQHICGKNRLGRFEVRRITDGKRRRKKLQELKQELRRRMHAPIAQVGEWLRSVLRGYYQYHAIPGDLAILSRFRQRVVRLWHWTLCQRSQRRPTWSKLAPIVDHWLPIPHVVHGIRTRASTPDAARRHIQGKNRMR
jgi:RNA-directed DNA polymerase